MIHSRATHMPSYSVGNECYRMRNARYTVVISKSISSVNFGGYYLAMKPLSPPVVRIKSESA
jgi:hypothetical protein